MDVDEFTNDWERGWNSHDLDVIMMHYRDDIVFRSKKAVPLTGNGEIAGKPALRAYWAAALRQQPALKFQVEDVFVGHQMLVIVYRNHHDTLAAETLYFDDDGYVFQAAACHRPAKA
jgi:ketosteroid isomerase-like protein